MQKNSGMNMSFGGMNNIKKLLILLFSILISFNSYGLFEKTICIETDSQEKDGIIYLPNKTKPFTGKNLCKYKNGQNKSNGNVKKGFKDGSWTYWFENGEIKLEIVYSRRNFEDGKKISEKKYFKDGKIYVEFIVWYENGQKNLEGQKKDGKLDGKWTDWYKNSQKEGETNYKDGKKDGWVIFWHENGQKWSEGNYKDGKRDGKWTAWYENGQKQGEGNFKDGVCISDCDYFK